jgi:predicted ATPase/class 3 adenylate cyclase
MNRGADPPAEAASITTLFSDIEGSTRLWEQRPDEMRAALAAHDTLARECVERHRGTLVKTTGDGIHAVFGDAVDAVAAMVDLLLAVADPAATGGLPLKVRLGAHCGADEVRGGDYYGRDVNRAARIMSVAHGGQMLVSQAVADRVGGRWPAGASARDLGLVRLRDLAEPQRLFQVLHPALRADFPALRSLEATPNNLPQQLNRFIGRERESAEVKALLRTNRLVTLLGLGGLGKSRLSVQLAAEVLDDHPDGVWLVELAPVADGRLVPHAVAGVLAVQEEPGVSLAEALVRVLRERRLLVVLDNCEHVLPACAELAKHLLQAVPGLVILATSREALRIAGEAVYALPALSAPPVPPRGATGARAAMPPLEALLEHDAVRLFVDRAQAAQRGFRLDAANAAAVAEVCAQLDGIPLALELAAARVRALSVEAIAERIGDRFRLLKTSDQTVLPRQRTLRALIDWSYDLLSVAERALFARLSVFAGGWTLEAAEAVTPGGRGDPIDRDDVLDLLASLVEKSLVAMDADGARYRYLETVRAYAAERLGEAGGEGVARAVSERHLAHFLDLAESLAPGAAGDALPAWMRRLQADRENLIAAHLWAIEKADDPALALRLAYALGSFWTARGQIGLAQSLSERSLSRPGASAPTLQRCGGLLAAGQDAYFAGDPATADRLLTEAEQIAEHLGEPAWGMRCAAARGAALVGLSRVTDARACFERALDLARSLGDRLVMASAAGYLGTLDRLEGHLDGAEARYGEALALAEAAGDDESAAIAALNMTIVRLMAHRTHDADRHLERVLDRADRLQSVALVQYVADVATGLAAERQAFSDVAIWHAAAESLRETTGLQRDAADEAFVQPVVESARLALGVDGFRLAAANAPTAAPEIAERLRAWLQSFADLDQASHVLSESATTDPAAATPSHRATP